MSEAYWKCPNPRCDSWGNCDNPAHASEQVGEPRCNIPAPSRLTRYGPCFLRRGHDGPGAHQHDETGRIWEGFHAIRG